jgi:hypothetical protein
MWRKGALAIGFGLVWVAACAGTSSGGGTQTNWVECRTSEECPSLLVCVNGLCLDPAEGDAGSSDARHIEVVSTEPWLPPPGTYDCRDRGPQSFDQGAGQCVPPTSDIPAHCGNACWDRAGAPGPEGCRPSIVDEFGTRCCYPGGCGVDLGGGEGCQAYLELGDETVPAGSHCAASSATPARIYEGWMDGVVLTSDSIVIRRPGGVTRVSKGTCAAMETSIATVWDVTATDEAAYVIGSEAEAGASALLRVSLDGGVEEVPLVELFGANVVQPTNLAAAGTSAYAVVAVQYQPGAESETAIVEIPCCGSAPRIVASGLAAWQIPGAVIFRAATDGQTLVVAGYDAALDFSRGRVAGVFDFATNEAKLFFDFYSAFAFPVFAVAGGLVYLDAGSSIVGVGVADCAVTTVAARPKAEAITALAVDGGAVFWAEGYPMVVGARVFSKQGDAPETRLAEVLGTVDWIGVDAQDVFFRMKPQVDGS